MMPFGTIPAAIEVNSCMQQHLACMQAGLSLCKIAMARGLLHKHCMLGQLAMYAQHVRLLEMYVQDVSETFCDMSGN